MSSVAVLTWTVALCCAVAIYQAVTFYLGLEIASGFDNSWRFALAGLLAFWVDEDSKGRPEIDRPSFDIGLFMYLVWIIYLPYYLLRTRGRRGWLWIFGLFVLVFLGTLLQLAVYVAS